MAESYPPADDETYQEEDEEVDEIVCLLDLHVDKYAKTDCERYRATSRSRMQCFLLSMSANPCWRSGPQSQAKERLNHQQELQSSVLII